MTNSGSTPASVSSEAERLIRVNSQDQVLGTISKADAHTGDGTLHRAFSIFLFSTCGEVLLQQRAMTKRLWPGYWTNSCCSHPREGESYPQATQRRLHQELGVSCPLHYLYTFEYSAHYLQVGSEREVCSVYVGSLNKTHHLTPHPEEIMDCRWFTCQDIDTRVAKQPESLTPWFLLEWLELTTNRWQQVRKQLGQSVS